MIAKPKWTRITRTENIPAREGRPIRVGGLEIAIFNLNDRFLTIENECPHKGTPETELNLETQPRSCLKSILETHGKTAPLRSRLGSAVLVRWRKRPSEPRP